MPRTKRLTSESGVRLHPWALFFVAASTLLACVTTLAVAQPSATDPQARITRDVEAGRLIVVHVVVALCDNENQGIVPVPQHLGNGQDARSNLYWGALYGVRTFFAQQAGWNRLAAGMPGDARILERAVFATNIRRDGRSATVYVVADAWDGAEIKAAIEKFLTFAGERDAEKISVRQGSEQISLDAGGAAHLVAFVGHNGLMDLLIDTPPRPADPGSARSSMVLACASKPFFLDLLHRVGSHPLLLTTGLMAPEAYTLDAAIRSWVSGGSVADVREAAATAYARYQKCSPRAARNLFWGE